MPTVLITGANRGLGLEFVRQYAADGWEIIATCRYPDMASDLKEIKGNIYIRKMDITDTEQINNVSAEFGGKKIDVLLNNAAVGGPLNESASFGQIEIAAWLEVMRVNTMAPVKVAEAFFNQVKMSDKKLIVFISSRAGSVSERGLLDYHKPGGSYIYRSSKAALNAVAQSLAFDITAQGIGVLVLHPGWVKTRMGTEEAIIDEKTSVTGMRRLIKQFSLADTGIFRNYDGKIISW